MVKRQVYENYMKSSGGSFFWLMCVAFYVAFEAGNLGKSKTAQGWEAH